MSRTRFCVVFVAIAVAGCSRSEPPAVEIAEQGETVEPVKVVDQAEKDLPKDEVLTESFGEYVHCTDEKAADFVLIVERSEKGAIAPTSERFPFKAESAGRCLWIRPYGICSMACGHGGSFHKSVFVSGMPVERTGVDGLDKFEPGPVEVRISTWSLNSETGKEVSDEIEIKVPWMGETPWMNHGDKSVRGRVVSVNR
jgi:hypothetical protein